MSTVERFKGVNYRYPADDIDATFIDGDDTEVACKAEIAKLDAIFNEFRDLLSAFTAAR